RGAGAVVGALELAGRSFEVGGDLLPASFAIDELDEPDGRDLIAPRRDADDPRVRPVRHQLCLRWAEIGYQEQGGTGEHREAEDHDVPVGLRATERACPVPDGMIVDVPLVAHLTGSARLASAAAAGPSGVFVEVGLATGGLIVAVRVVEEDGLS